MARRGSRQAKKGRCAGAPISRRTFLQVGMIGGLGLTLDHFLRSRSAFAGEGIAVPKATPRADSVIHIFLPGG
ncbi:MAG: hypothetical protein QF752_10680, partial [Planctomycetota bacterium]|nr:hypothetical protein [Planctomycetota bacterium]